MQFQEHTRAEPARDAPGEADVRRELDHLLASPHLQASERRRAFLRHVVEETLAGRGDRLKGYSIALAVFGRDESFDTQSDPVVRLEARRLRRDLDSYYVAGGSHDPVRISIPKGGYLPVFEWLEPPGVSAPGAPAAAQPAAGSGTAGAGPPEPPGPTAADPGPTGPDLPAAPVPRAPAARAWRWQALALLLAAMAATLAAVLWRSAPPGDGARTPAIVVLPFDVLDTSPEGHFLAAGVRQKLIADLMRFPAFRLYDGPAVGGPALPDPGTSPAGTYLVGGSIRLEPGSVRLSAQASDAATGRILWSETYDRPRAPDALIALETELAGALATALGQPYGVVSAAMLDRAATAAVGVDDMASYLCVLRAYDYRRSFLRDKYQPVLDCLEQTVRRDPGYSDAWAMLGWLYLDAARFGLIGAQEAPAAHTRALDAATRAVQLAPDSVLALKALSSINYYMGHYTEAELQARRAVELNPYDPDTLAQLGWRLAARGNFAEGIPILREAIARSVQAPGWYYHLIAIDLYRRGAYREMLEVAERSSRDGSGVSQALIAIAAGALGDRDRAARALVAMQAVPSLAADPAGFFRRQGATEQIVGQLVDGLATARRVGGQS